MNVAICLRRTGGPEVLQIESITERSPGAGEAWVEQEAIGVNYLDVMQRNGSAPISLPSGLGLEGAGRVVAVGRDVDEVREGDRVGYFLGPLGSYASGRLFPADRLILLPADVRAADAAAILFKGATAHYLLHSTYPVREGTVVLLYGAAGALGQIMARWAKALGAKVIGVVSKEASVARARSAGCDAVLVWGASDLPAEVARLSDGQKAHVVYDGIGKLTFAASLQCLRPRGTMVSIGASTGTPDPVAIGMLAKDSLFLTRPGLAAHASDIDEYRERSRAVLAALDAGIIKPDVWKTFPLAEAQAAHAALEGGSSAGAILLRP